jgi:glycosyltransferase involved in cell wall biosynthesis
VKILLVSEQWWPEGTGGILASHLITQILRDAGFDITVIHGTRKLETVEDIDYAYTELLAVRNKCKLWINCYALAKQAWFLESMRNYDVVYIPRYCYPLIPLAKKLCKRVVVHLHDYQPVSYNSVVFYGKKRNSFNLYADAIKFEVLEHDSVLRALGASTAPMNMLSRLWLKGADAIICVSNRQAEIVSNLAPELAHKIRVIYNPLPEPPPLEEKFADPTFTFAGGGSYVKGFHILMQALLSVLKRRKSISFMFAGGFRGFRQRHVKLLERLSSSHIGDFKLLGHLPYEDVLRLYSRSHAVVVPSIWEEPLPYVVMEAMAMGTLPIASRVGGIPEIVEGTYAENMLFEVGNVEELVERMESVLAMSREQIEDVGLSLREAMLKRFDPKRIKRDLMRAFS